MITMSRAVQVNPADEPIKLTREDVWQGLEMKANNALPFVKVMQRCEVVDRGANWLLRDIQIDGEPYQERVTLTPMSEVKFERTKGRVMGTILNTLEEEKGELMLRFSFNLWLVDEPAGGPAEKKFENDMREAYLAAVASTLAAVRRMAGERQGKIKASA